MTLTPGTKLGRYEVLAPLGAGGMGEVYRARDTKLAREVAVKVLPDHLANDRVALARFQREARAVAALSHPNILAIFDAGDAGDVPYAVTELLDGQTLRSSLLHGPPGARRALEIAEHVAAALAAAHENGIVHRDVKPENVFLTRDGQVKVLDFGLARRSAAAPSGNESLSVPAPLPTEPGVVAGTVAYMSPEQARGEAVDFRSDQFSLGVMLYELLTGCRPFVRDSTAETLTAILRDEPEPLEQKAPHVPAPVRWLVERLLAKEPAARYDSTRDLARELGTLREHLSESAEPTSLPPAAPARRVRRVAVWAAAGLALAAALGATFLLGRRSGVPTRPTFQQLTFVKGLVTYARFTPDGNGVICTARRVQDYSTGTSPSDDIRLFSTRVDSPVPVPFEPGSGFVVGTRGGEVAILVPRASVAIGSGRPGPGLVLATVPLGGGTPRPVLDGVLLADWSTKGGEFAVVRSADGGRSRLEYPPGKVLLETTGNLAGPRISPDGSRVAFLSGPVKGDSTGTVAVVDTAGRVSTLSGDWGGISGIDWSPDGNEVWFTAGKVLTRNALHAVSLDGRLRTVLEAPSNLNLLQVFRDGRVLLASGTWTYEAWGRAPGDTAERPFSWLDGTTPWGASADGKTLFFSEDAIGGGRNGSIFVRRLGGSAPVRLGEGTAAALSPDGAWAVSALLLPEPSLRLVPTGPGETRVLPRGPLTCTGWASFFPDGRRLLVVAHAEGRPVRLCVQELSGGPPRPFSPEGLTIAHASSPVSPDGKWVAAIREDEGGPPVLVAVEGGEVRPLEGLEPGERPLGWSKDGRSLFVRELTSSDVARVVRFDPVKRTRTLWKELRPAEPAGAYIWSGPLVVGDGEAYFYTVTRHLSNLYLVEGLR